MKAGSQGVQVTAKVSRVHGVNAAKFTICPKLRGSVCKLGNLPAGQSDELQASVTVGKAAALGERVRLTVTAKAPKATSFHASASVVVASPPASTPPAPEPSATVPTSGTLPPATLPALPSSGGGGNGNLFPTVTPGASSSASPSSSAPSHSAPHRARVHAATVSAILPLDTRLIGGQLAGLAVLAGAIAIAITRLSLRTRRPEDGKNPPS
jgi:hypothetical protein